MHGIINIKICILLHLVGQLLPYYTMHGSLNITLKISYLLRQNFGYVLLRLPALKLVIYCCKRKIVVFAKDAVCVLCEEGTDFLRSTFYVCASVCRRLTFIIQNFLGVYFLFNS